MATIEKSITIKVAPEKVYDYFVDPAHLPEIWPSMVEVRDIKPLPNGGHRYHWLYKMAGVKFEGDTETVELIKNEKLVSKVEGGIESRFDWEFKPENGFTRMTVKADFKVPPTLLGKLKEPFLVKLNEHEAEIMLANLKDRMEL
jgi:uncharacterized protein YndB with AHSA1/START domain